MKDARWQLATDMLQHTSFAGEINSLPYPITEGMFRIAQSVLEQLKPGEVEVLARRWNDAPRATDNDLKRLIRSAIGYDLVPLSIRDHPEIRAEFRTADDADGLVERIHDAIMALDDHSMTGVSKADLPRSYDLSTDTEVDPVQITLTVDRSVLRQLLKEAAQ